MDAPWDYPDFDDHEIVQFVTDRASGLRAVIAIHSTFLGPAGGGVRLQRYADAGAGLRDALRLSRGMSYKNAMAGLPMGGGKAVILADETCSAEDAETFTAFKTPELLAAYGRAVESFAGRYVTAEDMNMKERDMVALSRETRHVAGLTVADGTVGGDPGPHTSYGVFLGLKAAVRRGLGKDSVKGVHIAVQGAGSVASGVARLAAKEGARITVADPVKAKAEELAREVGGQSVAADEIMTLEADVLSPNAIGGILTEESIAALKVPVVAGGANNQLATAADGQRIHQRGILYAPDYVINAGGIINVALEYFGGSTNEEVDRLIEKIPGRLEEIWSQSAATGLNPAEVADALARQRIGR